jgi:hypothetical protein
MEIKSKKTSNSFLGYRLQPCIEEIWRFFSLILGQIMAIENLKKVYDIYGAVLILNISFWLYIYI